MNSFRFFMGLTALGLVLGACGGGDALTQTTGAGGGSSSETGATTSSTTSTGGSGGASSVCGDGKVDMGEECDDMGESAMCNADCTKAECGDMTVNMTAGEACDDGAESAMCNDDCSKAECGDGKVNNTAGETCDDMGRSDMCDDDCTAVTCGDGKVNTTAGEVCDGDGMGMGGETAMCDADCTKAECGDMTVNMTAKETCDEGMETAMCDDDCTKAECGDGKVNATAKEACDGDGMGMGGETATCDDDCSKAECGDGKVNATAKETCDGDGMGMGGETATCDDDCTKAECGDNVLNATAGEQCDDGNTMDGDGCSATCTFECVNVAPLATASHSGGGANQYGPARANDGKNQADCVGTKYSWINSSLQQPGKYWRFDWATPQVIGSVVVDSVGMNGDLNCGAGATRYISKMKVQYLDQNNQWQTVQTVSGKDNYQVSFPQPVTTKSIRLMDVLSGGGNALLWEVYAYAAKACPLPAGI